MATATRIVTGVDFVAVSTTIDSGVCFQAFFDDADGNRSAIHRRYVKS
jgi:hypothetical protein